MIVVDHSYSSMFLLTAGRSDVDKEETVCYQRIVWGQSWEDQRSDSQALWGGYIYSLFSLIMKSRFYCVITEKH